jgi:hypothetical protein
MPFIDENPMRRQPIREPEPQYVADDFFWTKEALWEAIQEGLNSGPPVKVDFDELLKKFRADRAERLRRNGEA